MATAKELEDMTAGVRVHREHGRIPEAEWHRLVEAAESAFDGQLRARGNDRLLDHDQIAAMSLAREIGVVDRERENPFQNDQLRRAFDSERLYDRSIHGNQLYESAQGSADRDQAGAKSGVSTPEWNRAVIDAELSIEARQLTSPGSADPILQLGMQIPANQQSRAREVASTLAHSEDVGGQKKLETHHAEPGRSYEGRVVGVTSDHVFQQVGERTITHYRQALTGRGLSADERGLQGREVKIDYPHGWIGLVREGGQQQQIGNKDKALQKDYGGREK